MIFLLSNGWGYIHIPKNASTLLKSQRIDYKAREWPVWPYSRVFAVIRHPFDRLVSAHADKFFDMELEEFVSLVCATPDTDADVHFRSQASFLDQRYPDLLVNFDKLDRELVRMSLNAPRMNATDHPPWQNVLGSTDALSERYAADLRLFGML